ncbi:hypothetical protein ACHAPJ_005278 [Fusarium lateritium]
MRGGKYIAGMWEQDLPRALLWQIWWHGVNARPSKYQEPSWSWTAINGPVWGAGLGGNLVPEVESVECELDHPEAPFGALKRGTLRINGPTLDLEWKYTKRAEDEFLFQGTTLRCPADDGEYIEVKFTLILDARPCDLDWTRMTLLAILFDQMKTSSAEESAIGIALQDNSEGGYSRLGYFWAKLERDEVHEDRMLPALKTWKRKTLVIN